MADTQTLAARPDIDIQNDIENLVVHYPPLNNDRHHLRVEVHDGAVILTGHVKTPVSLRYLLDNLSRVRGVTGVDTSQLFVDEAIRLEIGRRLPPGVIGNVEYGTVILSGKLPPDTSAESVVSAIGSIPGVRRVLTALRA